MAKSNQLKIEGIKEAETKKGENAMNTQFDVWNDVKIKICEEYLNAEKKPEFEIKVKFMDDFTTRDGKDIEGARKVLNYLVKQKAFKNYETTEMTDVAEDGTLKRVYVVKINDFDAFAQATSKTNKQFYLFKDAMGKALAKQMYAKATV